MNSFAHMGNLFVRHQENLFTYQLLSPMSFDFPRLRTKKDITDILGNVVKMAEQGERLGRDVFLDTYFKAQTLLSFADRFKLHSFLYHTFQHHFVGIPKKRLGQQYHQPMVQHLNKYLSRLMRGELAHCHTEERVLIYKLTYQCYLLLLNNKVGVKKASIDFNKRFIAIISKTVQLNSYLLRD